MPTARKRRGRSRSFTRVMIGLAVMVFIVGANIYATREYGGFVFDLGTEMNAIDL